jgi:hypothetical protein
VHALQDPRQRATIHQLLQHEWISSSLQEYQQTAATADAASVVQGSIQEPASVQQSPAEGMPPASVAGGVDATQRCASCIDDSAASQPLADTATNSSNGRSSSSHDSSRSNSLAAEIAGQVGSSMAVAVSAGRTAPTARIKLAPITAPRSRSSIESNAAQAAPAPAAGAMLTAPAVTSSDAKGNDNSKAQPVRAVVPAGALETWASSSTNQASHAQEELPPACRHIEAVAAADLSAAAAVAAVSTEGAAVIARSRDGSATSNAGASAVNTAVAATEAIVVVAEEPEPAEEAVEAAESAAAAKAAATRKARLARASSHHGHRLHKIFYPHDKHRRSSFCNAQWDDFIDTSAHSFSSAAAAAADVDAASPDDAAGDSTASGAGDEGSSSGGLLGLVHAGSVRSSMVSSGSFSQLQQSLRRRPSATAAALAAADGLGLVARGPRSFSMSGTSAALAQQAVLASLPDADQQAPAAVLSTAASGAVHLLAATDFEDMIALGPTPSDALSSLGLVVPAADAAAVSARSCSFSGVGSNSILSLPSAASCGLQGCGVAGSCGGEAAAAGRALTTLTGSNLDDFIATSASPGGRVSLLHVSRSSSTANMSGDVGSARCSASPPSSPGCSSNSAAAAGGSSSFSSSLVVTVSSPRPSTVRGTAANSNDAGAAGMAPGKPVGVATTLGARLSCLLPGDGGSALQSAAASLPANPQRDGGSTPTGSRKVVWADEAAEPASGRISSRPASGCGSGASGRTGGASLQLECGCEQQDGNVLLKRSNSQPALAQPLQPAARQQAGSPSLGSQFYVPPSGVLSGDAPCCPSGVRASKAALAAGVLRHRSASCSPADLRTAAAGTLGQQQQQINRSSRPGYVGRRSTSSSGASPVFKAAVPFGAVSGGFLRRGGAASQSMANLALASGAGAGMLQGPEIDAGDEIVTRQRAKSFTAGTSLPLAAGGRRHGALTPTRVAAGGVLQRSLGV